LTASITSVSFQLDCSLPVPRSFSELASICIDRFRCVT
jgi:hypothetical protein